MVLDRGFASRLSLSVMIYRASVLLLTLSVGANAAIRVPEPTALPELAVYVAGIGLLVWRQRVRSRQRSAR